LNRQSNNTHHFHEAKAVVPRTVTASRSVANFAYSSLRLTSLVCFVNSNVLLLNISIQEAFILTYRARSSRHPQVATIDPSIPSSDLVPPLRASTEHNPPQSSSRPPSRRSNINSQIFQFALGYPQTPPDTTPDPDPIGPLLEGDSSGAQSDMGSFLFQWYVETSLSIIGLYKSSGVPNWLRSFHRRYDCLKDRSEFLLNSSSLFPSFATKLADSSPLQGASG